MCIILPENYHIYSWRCANTDASAGFWGFKCWDDRAALSLPAASHRQGCGKWRAAKGDEVETFQAAPTSANSC